MALTDLQNELLRLLAKNRLDNPQSYVAGGLALNYVLGTPRLSRDIDIFHDSKEAMYQSWVTDRKTLEGYGCTVRPLRELEYFIEAEVSLDGRRADLCRYWREEVERARTFLVDFPRAEAGKAVLDEDGHPFKGNLQEFKDALSNGRLVFHEGTIGGAWPVIVG